MTHTERISTRRVAKSNPRPTTPPKFCALCGGEVLAGDSYGVSYFNPFYFPYFEIIECGPCMDDFIAECSEYCVVEKPPKLEGRTLTAMLAPKKAK